MKIFKYLYCAYCTVLELMSLVTSHLCTHADMQCYMYSSYCLCVLLIWHSHAYIAYSANFPSLLLHNPRLPLKQIHTHTPGTHANPCAFTLLEKTCIDFLPLPISLSLSLSLSLSVYWLLFYTTTQRRIKE